MFVLWVEIVGCSLQTSFESFLVRIGGLLTNRSSRVECVEARMSAVSHHPAPLTHPSARPANFASRCRSRTDAESGAGRWKGPGLAFPRGSGPSALPPPLPPPEPGMSGGRPRGRPDADVRPQAGPRARVTWRSSPFAGVRFRWKMCGYGGGNEGRVINGWHDLEALFTAAESGLQYFKWGFHDRLTRATAKFHLEHDTIAKCRFSEITFIDRNFDQFPM